MCPHPPTCHIGLSMLSCGRSIHTAVYGYKSGYIILPWTTRQHGGILKHESSIGNKIRCSTSEAPNPSNTEQGHLSQNNLRFITDDRPPVRNQDSKIAAHLLPISSLASTAFMYSSSHHGFGRIISMMISSAKPMPGGLPEPVSTAMQ